MMLARPDMNTALVVGRTGFMPGTLALAIAASVIAVVTGALVLFTLRLGRILERLDEKQQERQQRAIVQRTRRYGQAAGSRTSPGR